MFYKSRPAGKDFMPPFAVGHVAYCAGEASPIEGEEPFDWYLFAVPKVDINNELIKDMPLFIQHDLLKYDITSDVLIDG